MARTMKTAKIIKVVLLALLAIPMGMTAFAGQDHLPMPRHEASQWHSSDHARVRLIRGGLSEDGRDLAALEIELDEGWHTYWRSPGRLGLPPTLNWDGSENVRGIEISWPAPEHIAFGDYETYGYWDHLILPLVVAREDTALPAIVNLAVGYAICEEVCIPIVGFVSLHLPGGEDAAHHVLTYREWIEGALAQSPTGDLAAAGLEADPALLIWDDESGHALHMRFQSETAFVAPHVIVEGPKGTSFGRPQLSLSDEGRALDALVPIEREVGAASPMGTALVATVLGGAAPVELTLDPVIASEDLAHSP